MADCAFQVTEQIFEPVFEIFKLVFGFEPLTIDWIDHSDFFVGLIEYWQKSLLALLVSNL